MAEVNTENPTPNEANADQGVGGKGFIFGQNMEDRVIRPNADSSDVQETSQDKEECKGENGTEASGEAKAVAEVSPAPPLTRPSVFRPTSGIIAPGKLGTNPFTQASPGGTTSNASAYPDGGLLARSKLAPNPFAARPANVHAVSSSTPTPNTSDSEDEKKDKPIVAPAHLRILGALARPGATVNQDGCASNAKFVLRPSALDRQTANLVPNSTTDSPTSLGDKPVFTLKPATLQSPFPRGKSKGSTDKEASLKDRNGTSEAQGTEEQDKPSSTTSDEAKERLFGDTAESTKENYFTQFSQSEAGSSEKNTDPSSSCGPGFVFGQNMGQRVSGGAACVSPSSSNSSFVFGENLADRVVNPAPSSPETEQEEPSSATDEQKSPTQTLAESAAAHQAKQTKPEFQEVEVKTGEEDESNVLQLNAKLYAFDVTTHSWVERGRGLLRLNDMSASDARLFHSRLIMRTQGSLRVVLNTKVWPGMQVERASQKSVRITAMDGTDGVKVFLIMASHKDADQLFSAIDWRVQQLKVQQNSETKKKGVSDVGSSQESLPPLPLPEKRPSDSPEADAPTKKARLEPDQRRETGTEESNDSSTLDPETEEGSQHSSDQPS